MTLTFEELRKTKDRLPDGSMKRIAEELGMNVETVRNYFGGSNFDRGEAIGIHFEPGPGGGIVRLDNTEIYDMAQKILEESRSSED